MPPLGDTVRALLEDGPNWLEAELAFQKARAGFVLGRAKGIALWAVLGLFLAFFTLVALVVGLLLALSSVIGPWGALGIVTLGLVALTGVCVAAALHGVRVVKRAITGEEA